jgi:prevent-host-death family protein
MLSYTITEAKAKLAEVVMKANAGEEIIITKMGKEAARIVPPKKKAKKPNRLGFMKGKGSYYMADDFNEWPEDIARALGMID